MSSGERDIIYIGRETVLLNGDIESTVRQITDSGTLPDTEDLLKRFSFYRFFSPDRVIKAEEGTRGYGGTEILAAGLKTGLLEAVVSVCDGVGTIVTDNPQIVYGIGNEQPLIQDTRRIDALAKRLIAEGVHILDHPGIDQIGGVKKALKLGHKSIGVTLTLGEIRKYRCPFEIIPGGYRNVFDIIPNSDIYTVCYYPDDFNHRSHMDLAFTEKEFPDLQYDRIDFKKVRLNILTPKGAELIKIYELDRFGGVKFRPS
ncbi:DUF2099 family protein [Candidatus Daviesbacteria bacterium]|nr:DUF2099 family protein [Candidatus Daviesbacteria bacterium]